MTAEGELYINETCRDTFIVELNDMFGVDKWKLDGSPFSECYDIRNFPDKVEVDVLNEKDEIIGRVEIINNFLVEGDDFGRYIEIVPLEIKKL